MNVLLLHTIQVLFGGSQSCRVVVVVEADRERTSNQYTYTWMEREREERKRKVQKTENKIIWDGNCVEIRYKTWCVSACPWDNNIKVVVCRQRVLYREMAIIIKWIGDDEEKKDKGWWWW